jgi:hypothetical protein
VNPLRNIEVAGGEEDDSTRLQVSGDREQTHSDGVRSMAARKWIRQTAELEQENAKLKRLRAELSVDKLVLKDIAAGNDLGPICGQNGGRHCHSTPLSLRAVAYFRSDVLIRSEPTCGLVSDTGEPLFCVKTWAQAALARESAAASQRMRRKPKTNASSTACSIRGSLVWMEASRERCFSIDCRSGAGRAS